MKQITKIKKRALSLLLCSVMLFTLCPQVAAAAGSESAESCTCETRCTADAIDEDCPVCTAEDADLSACTGAEPESAPEPAAEPEAEPDLGATPPTALRLSRPVWMPCPQQRKLRN